MSKPNTDPHPELLAKSESGYHGGLSVYTHVKKVGDAAQALARKLGMDEILARRGGVLHDIGKAHPVFQLRLRKEPDRSFGEPFRHELASLLFLPLFNKAEWPALCEMIVAHHKSVKGDKRGFGLLDFLENEYRHTWLDFHAGDWSTWSPKALAILKALALPGEPIEESEARHALNWCIDYCENLQDGAPGWSAWRGLLMAADHMVSAVPDLSQERLEGLFNVPDLSYFNRSNELYPLSLVDASSPKPHTLVVAPTGAGKTDFLLRRCRGRVFYTLPFQASINAMHNRMTAALGQDADVRLLHASSRLAAQDVVEIELQPHVGAAVKVLTPHQLAKVVFAGPGFEAQLLDLRNADVILDEVHTYNDVTQALVLELTRVMRLHGCRVHIGTATMPSPLFTRLLALLGGESETDVVQLSDKQLATYDRHVVHKLDSAEAIEAIIAERLEKGQKILIVYNTVNAAQEACRGFREKWPSVSSLLLHSRFRRVDRQALEKRLMVEFDAQPGPCLVVATQVVEVSLDISFDCMITEAAPLDALIQRFGRVNRRRTQEIVNKNIMADVYVLAPKDRPLPYQTDVVRRSYDELPDGRPLHTVDLQASLDRVYPELKEQSIASHVFWDDKGVIMPPLQHIGKPVLMELLEIDSAACIRSEDLSAYERADWKQRTSLEIPVNGKTIWRHKDKYVQIEEGARPFVVPEADYDEELGLSFNEPDIFLT